MAQENVERVRQAFDAYDVGGVEAVRPFLAPDVVCYAYFLTWQLALAAAGLEG